MTQPDYWRQEDVVSPVHLSFPITLVGAGGIGSPTALALAKMGCSRLTVYDHDRIEAHNLPNQVYRVDDVGRPKVEALRDIVAGFTGSRITAVHERFGGASSSAVVISAVDTMEARAEIWHEGVRLRVGTDLYIDARMGAEVCRIYCVHPTDPDEIKSYESTLYSDEMAAADVCTAQAVIYNVFGIAALIANMVKRYALGERYPFETILDFATLTLLER